MGSPFCGQYHHLRLKSSYSEAVFENANGPPTDRRIDFTTDAQWLSLYATIFCPHFLSQGPKKPNSGKLFMAIALIDRKKRRKFTYYLQSMTLCSHHTIRWLAHAVLSRTFHLSNALCGIVGSWHKKRLSYWHVGKFTIHPQCQLWWLLRLNFTINQQQLV